MFESIPVGDNVPETFNAVIEIPRGSANKYEYDKDVGAIVLDRVLYSPMFYPVNYGLVPQTAAEDGDEMDALILSSQPIHPGIVVEARTVGLLDMKDEKGIDHKLLGVAKVDPRMNKIQDVDDVEEHFKKETEHFFRVYKELEEKFSEVTGWRTKQEGQDQLMQDHKRWQERHDN